MVVTGARFDLQSCGVLVFRREPQREFLLMRHADRWDLPKGHVDPGESELACALRELREETGIPADAVGIDPSFEFHHEYHVTPRGGGPPLLKRLTVFLGDLVRPCPIQTSEHLDFQWFAWRPPHCIQVQTIDPLLAAVDRHWRGTAM